MEKETMKEASRIVEALAGLDLSRMHVLMMEDSFKDARKAEGLAAVNERWWNAAEDRVGVLTKMLAAMGMTAKDIDEGCERGLEALEEERQKWRDENRW